MIKSCKSSEVIFTLTLMWAMLNFIIIDPIFFPHSSSDLGMFVVEYEWPFDILSAVNAGPLSRAKQIAT